MGVPQDPGVQFLGIYPKNAPLYCKDTHSAMFIAALFIIRKNCKQHQCPSAEEWISKSGIFIQWNITYLLKTMA